MNYEQLTSLFRVEERSVAYVSASVVNILITVGMTVLLVVGLKKGPTGAIVGNFIGTLTVYIILLAYRRYQLGLQFDRNLLRAMNKFGLPLVPAAEPISTLVGGGDLASRIGRLLDERTSSARQTRVRLWIAGPIGCAAAAALYTPLLHSVHEATEVLIRFLP